MALCLNNQFIGTWHHTLSSNHLLIWSLIQFLIDPTDIPRLECGRRCFWWYWLLVPLMNYRARKFIDLNGHQSKRWRLTDWDPHIQSYSLEESVVSTPNTWVSCEHVLNRLRCRRSRMHHQTLCLCYDLFSGKHLPDWISQNFFAAFIRFQLIFTVEFLRCIESLKEEPPFIMFL